MNSPPPVSLGKPSLRHRLESYYSLIAPDAISDPEKWKKNFEIIHAKYGGTVEGETKLASKLAKKYGDRVKLLVAPPHRSMQRRQLQRGRSENAAAGSKRDESYYDIDKSRRDSRVLNFASPRFDALHALAAPESIVVEANPTIFSVARNNNTKLDNISKFRSFLPECDPQRLEPQSVQQRKRSVPGKRDGAISNNPNEPEAKEKKLPMFLSMASKYETKTSGGPLSLLYSIMANRQRARIMVRYVDCIRGTLTGYLIAFDKHFNMILKDVDEVYSGRVTRHADAMEVAGGHSISLGGCVPKCDGRGDGDATMDDASAAPSKAKLEAQRRRCYPPDGSGGPGPAVKQRYFHQLMVRGDNVVMVWRADAERSVHPHTNKSPAHSLYKKDENKLSDDSGGGKQAKVGTPGSLYYALQRWENRSRAVSSRQKPLYR